MNILKSLRSEILKTRRTPSYYFTLVAAALTPLLLLVFALLDGFSQEEQQDPFNAIFKRFEMTGMVILPIFIILICTLLPQAEYRNNTWKQVFASPQPKSNVFIAKQLNIHLLILLFLVINLLLMFLVAVAAHFIFPDLRLLNHPLNWKQILINNANVYVELLAITAIQFWLGLRFQNFIGPVAIGISLWLAGTMLVWGYKPAWGLHFPYSFQTFWNIPAYRSQLDEIGLRSAGYAILFLIVGYLDFKRIKVNHN